MRVYAVIAIVLDVLFGSSLIKVDTKEVALIYRLGKLDRIEQSGLHFRLPYPLEHEERLETKYQEQMEVFLYKKLSLLSLLV